MKMSMLSRGLTGIVLLLLLIFLPAAAQRQFRWLQTVGSPIGGGSQANFDGEFTKYLCLDDNRNIYAASSVGDTSIIADTFRAPGRRGWSMVLLSSYTCEGRMRWARPLDIPLYAPGPGWVTVYGLQYRSGSIYLAGRFADTPGNIRRRIAGVQVTGHDSQNYFLARFDTLGRHIWTRFAGANNRFSMVDVADTRTQNNQFGLSDHALALDGSGKIHHFVYLKTGVHVTPTLTARSGTYDLVYDSLGNLLSAVRLGVDSSYFLYNREPSNNLRKNSLCISPRSGKIFAVFYKSSMTSTGWSNSSSSRLCAFSPSGALLWEDTVVKDAAATGALRDVVYDGDNGIYLSGEKYGGNFIFQGLAPSIVPLGGAIAALQMIIKVDTNRRPAWMYTSQSFGTAISRLANTTILPDGNILAAGFASRMTVHGTDTFDNGRDGAIDRTGAIYTIVLPSGKLVKMDGNRATKGNRNTHWNSFECAAVDKLGNISWRDYRGRFGALPRQYRLPR